MPYKDPEAAKASKRAYYLAHKELFLQRSKKRRELLQQKTKALKEVLALLPTPIVPRTCVDCGIDITHAYTPKHGPHCKACVAAYNRTYRAKNAARIASLKVQWKLDNKAHVEAKDRAYALANPEKRAAARKKWSSANPGKDLAAKALNRRSRQKRVPTWLSDDDKWFIEQLYDLAALRTRLLGFSWHVDHIIPLNGKKVSGLHVPSNLQVIPAMENLRKHNKFEVSRA